MVVYILMRALFTGPERTDSNGGGCNCQSWRKFTGDCTSFPLCPEEGPAYTLLLGHLSAALSSSYARASSDCPELRYPRVWRSLSGG